MESGERDCAISNSLPVSPVGHLFLERSLVFRVCVGRYMGAQK